MNKPYSDWKYSYKAQKKKHVLKEFEEWSRQDFIAHILQLRQEVLDQEKTTEELQSTVEKLKAENKDPLTDENTQAGIAENKYCQNWAYSTKIVFTILFRNFPLTSCQIHELLRKMDAGFKYLKDPKKYLTVRLCQLVKTGRIKSVKLPGIKTLYYALPEWVNETGRLGEEYLKKISFFD